MLWFAVTGMAEDNFLPTQREGINNWREPCSALSGFFLAVPGADPQKSTQFMLLLEVLEL